MRQRLHRMICWWLGHRWYCLAYISMPAVGKIVTVWGCGRGSCGQKEECVVDAEDLEKRHGRPSGNYRSN